ncbi:MAG: hypothetical protein JXA96_14735 [Sedimentisphaerales bacterium]|nr:hypothetical protein [Sedimentisphaerales bacterium]
MIITASLILASFTQPVNIGVNQQSMLWMIPLFVSFSIVYKTIKLPNLKFVSFLKEVVVLFGSIMVFIIITAVVLYACSWLLIE